MSEISVIIPAKNAATTVGRTLQSLAPDAALIGEILVIDDGSADQTAAQAKHIGDELGLPVSVQRVNCGSAGGARNCGIARARFPLVYFIDADDVLIAGMLGMMCRRLVAAPGAKLIIGASTRMTPGRKELRRTPRGYGDEPLRNAAMYLENGAPPIAMGSALVRRDALHMVRFPENCPIDEDTWFWSALLAQFSILTVPDVIVSYHLDEQRTANRFCRDPRKTWLAIVAEFEKFRALGIPKSVISYRKAWLAQRFARQLIKVGRFREARMMLRPVVAHPELPREIRTWRYRILSRLELGARQKQILKVAQGTRTAVITYDPAWPPVSGADLRNSQNALMAAQKGSVLLASVRDSLATEFPTETARGVAVISATHAQDPKGRSLNPRRLGAEPRISRKALERLKRALIEFKPDTIVLEGIYLRSLIVPLAAGDHQIILDMHNVESDLERQMTPDKTAGRAQRMAAKFRNHRLCRAEKRAISHVDKVWLCTDQDRSRVIDKYGIATPMHVVPNGIPRPWIAAKPLAPMTKFCDAPRLIYVGHLGYGPNIVAVERLAHRIFPSIRAEFPTAELQIVGRYPKPQIQALAQQPGVNLHENPADIGPFLARADLTIIPLTQGGGSRIKILEAAAHGVPVIATKLAAEGLELMPNVDLRQAQSDEEIVRCAIELLRNDAMRASLRENAYGTVQRLYGAAEIARMVGAGLGK